MCLEELHVKARIKRNQAPQSGGVVACVQDDCIACGSVGLGPGYIDAGLTPMQVARIRFGSRR